MESPFLGGEFSADRLRMRYLDWCAAKVAERFLQLTPEEVWARAAAAGETPDPVGTPDAEKGVFVSHHYVTLARSLAHQIAQELDLPPADEWIKRYQADPTPFEEEILLFRPPPTVSESEPRSSSG